MAFPFKPVAQLLGSNGPIHAVAYSASPGTYILTGSADRSIRLYNPQSNGGSKGSQASSSSSSSTSITAAPAAAAPALPEGKLIQEYSGHGYDVLSLAVAGDNARFASSGGDRAVFLWDVATATTLRRFGSGGAGGGAPGEWGHSSRVNCVAWAGEGDTILASGGFDTTVKLWDCKGGGSNRPIQTLTDARDGISALAVRGPEVLAGSVDGRVRCYDVRMGRCVVDVVGASVTSLSLSRDGGAVLVGSLDSAVRLMDRRTGSCLRTYSSGGETEEDGAGGRQWKNESLRVQSLLGAGEKYVVAGDEMSGSGGSNSEEQQQQGHHPDEDGRVWAWDLLTGKVVATLRVPWGPPTGPAEKRKRVVGRDGKEKERKNVTSCIAWRENGWGDQFCVGGSSGAVTVFGSA